MQIPFRSLLLEIAAWHLRVFVSVHSPYLFYNESLLDPVSFWPQLHSRLQCALALLVLMVKLPLLDSPYYFLWCELLILAVGSLVVSHFGFSGLEAVWSGPGLPRQSCDPCHLSASLFFVLPLHVSKLIFPRCKPCFVPKFQKVKTNTEKKIKKTFPKANIWLILLFLYNPSQYFIVSCCLL